MSSWQRGTTADVALRVFALSPARIFVEASMGMQAIQQSDAATATMDSIPRNTGLWEVSLQGDSYKPDMEHMLLAWLDEVLYRGEVQNQWFVDGMLKIDLESGLIMAQVSYVDSELVEREVEIKAVTSHELHITEVAANEEIASPWDTIPTFVGPGFFSDIVFDI